MNVTRRTSCFVAGTLVSTPEGPRAIEDLAPGDVVWAAEFLDGELVLVPRRIVEVFERAATERLVLTYQTRDGERGVLELTPEHPLYAADHGLYVWAEDLEPGSALLLDDGRLAWIERAEPQRGEVTVYNLEVEVSHNYFAGAPNDLGAILVHNAEYGGPKAGIYEFDDAVQPGTKYVGQSKNLERRINQHNAVGRVTPGTTTTTEVTGDKVARELAEHKRIQEITGGVPARLSGKVSNKIDPIGPNRQHLLEPE